MKKAIFATVFLLLLTAVNAHERQGFTIGEKDYLFVIGSLNEPVAVDDKTGVDLRIILADPDNKTNSKAPNAKPMIGLEETLKVELIAGDKKKTLKLEPAYNDPGAYRAPFYPTVETTYTYRVFGEIEGTPVDLSFACNPAGHPSTPEDTTEVKLSESVSRTFKAGAFGCPKNKAELGFPEPSVHLAELEKTPEQPQSKLPLAAVVLSVLALVSTIALWLRD